MYSLLVATVVAFAVLALVSALLSPIAAIVPAVLVWFGVGILLVRRVDQRVQAEMQKVGALLQEQKLDEVRGLLEGLKKRWGKWQPLLEGQLDAQLGMFDYVQMKWDAALPRLEAGRFRNWMAQTCLGAIHYRKGNKAKAWEELEAAVTTAPKEQMVYLVYANLLVQAGERDKALKVLGTALENLPDNEHVKHLQADVANKRKVRTDKYPEAWYQFFPEELLKSQLVRGRKGVQPMVAQQPRYGARMAPRR